MNRTASFFVGVLAGGLLAAVVLVAARRNAEPKTFAEEMAAMSEADIQKLESAAQRLFSKGSYPLFASHVRSAQLAMAVYTHKEDRKAVEQSCAHELALFLQAASTASADRELFGIQPLIEEKKKEVEAFSRPTQKSPSI